MTTRTLLIGVICCSADGIPDEIDPRPAVETRHEVYFGRISDSDFATAWVEFLRYMSPPQDALHPPAVEISTPRPTSATVTYLSIGGWAILKRPRVWKPP